MSDEDIIKTRFRDNYSKLVARFDPKGPVLDELFEKHILTPKEYDKIRKTDDEDERGIELCQLLLKGGRPDGFCVFKQILEKHREYEWMVKLLEAPAGDTTICSTAIANAKGQHFEIRDQRQGVAGVTWIDSKIYVVFRESSKINVFPDTNPGHCHEEFEINGMKHPEDVTACIGSMSMFISEEKSTYLWKIEIPSKQKYSFLVDGQPGTLSTTRSDDLLVVMWKMDGNENISSYLDVYSPSKVERLKRIILPSAIKKAEHVVESSNGNFIVLYYVGKTEKKISEILSDGTIVKTLIPSPVGSFWEWHRDHLAIDESNNVFIAHSDGNRVDFLPEGRDLLALEIFKHRFEYPTRLCYVPKTKQLIVGQWKGSSKYSGNDWSSGISIFNLSTS